MPPSNDPAPAQSEPASSLRRIVLFDGDCGICNRGVRRLLRMDRHARLFVAPLAGEYGSELLRRVPALHGVDSLLFVEDDGDGAPEVLIRSAAVVRTLRTLGGVWTCLGWLLWLVPRPIRDVGYRVVAALRFRISRRLKAQPTCGLLPDAQRRRVLP